MPSGTPQRARAYPASWPCHNDAVENTVSTQASLWWAQARGRLCLGRRRKGRLASAGCRGRTFFPPESDTVHACHQRSAVTASQTATPSRKHLRSGAEKLAGGRHRVARQSAGVFRACRDAECAHRDAERRTPRWTDADRMVHGPPTRSRLRVGVPPVGSNSPPAVQDRLNCPHCMHLQSTVHVQFYFIKSRLQAFIVT